MTWWLLLVAVHRKKLVAVADIAGGGLWVSKPSIFRFKIFF